MPYQMCYLNDTPENREILRGVYCRMTAEGTAGSTFYDGTVRDAGGFVQDLLRPGSLPVIACTEEGEPAACAWFNSVEGRSARGHCVVFKPFWGRRRSVELARAIFEYILTRRDEQGYLFDVIIGVTPRSNALAWKLAEICGAVRVGIIPHGAFIAAMNITEDAVLTAASRESLELEA